MSVQRRIRVIGAPMDLGASRRGVDMGPFSVRVAGLVPRLRELGHTVIDDGNVRVEVREQNDPGNPRLRYLAQIVPVCEELFDRVYKAASEGDVTITIGGDHSIVIGSLAGVSLAYQEKGQKLGLLWFDAHGDFNTPETTSSGNIHGMPFAASLGYGAQELTRIGFPGAKFDAARCCLIGGRDLDLEERRNMRSAGIKVYTMRDIDERGMPTIMREALAIVLDGTSGVAVSLDMDGMDPAWAPGVGTPVKGGLSYREAHLAMEMVADTGKLVHLDMVEINPLLDTTNATSERGVELALSALGKTIY